MTKGHILIVDDEKRIRSALAGILKDEGHEVSVAEDGSQALEMIEKDTPDLIMLDIWMPGMDGIAALQKIREQWPDIAVVMISGHGNIETAVKTIKAGAYDFIEKPLSLEKTVLTVQHALEAQRLSTENRRLRHKDSNRYQIVGDSKAVKELERQIALAAPTNGWILITGENGTGKELVAREVHNRSRRFDKPFVGLNCAAIPEDLIESELFGHEKGSFTGATVKRKGRFELADQGTLFLDEVGDMSLKTQAKVLRALEEQSFQRIGGNKTISVDVRIIAASNKDLKKEMEKGNFREDLYYRLHVIPINIPSLRDRKEDVPLLVGHFLKVFSDELGKPLRTVTKEAMEDLLAYDWPGNVRELKNMVERLVIMVPGSHITRMDIPESLRKEHLQPSFRDAKKEFERRLITKAINACNGNISQAARRLKIERSLLHQKIKTLGLD
ncbi:sigma-54-dependent Fis family transcriptional regulator [bacterium]|nr:sigma-54-dependent Fis family transcriptional regulator [bacterium]